VALSRHRDRAVAFGSRAELESPQQEYLAGGPPTTDLDRLRRVAEQLAERAAAGERSADDRPVLDDLGRSPRPDFPPPHRPGPDRPGRDTAGRPASERARRGGARTAARRAAERARLQSEEPSMRTHWPEAEPTGGTWHYPQPEPPGRAVEWAEPEAQSRARGIERCPTQHGAS
jgi:hypothetical protein